MTKSVRSINIVVRLDFMGHDVSRHNIENAINNMEYNFSYEDSHIRLVDSEIIETFATERGLM